MPAPNPPDKSFPEPPNTRQPAADTPNAVVTKRLVGPERALLHGAFEFLLEALNEPVDFEVDAGVDEGVEVAGGVF
ncbi:hypothetical protein AARAC_010500 [Aspergillus arachidicola]|uniref:Uncharacterized protein n=1 Tax=Aspergillus arachidicola TaxID=656916 RepID=A0A2G7FFF1_9EURO|nr:hypothetical protein AARAC_010500 [Aspergillus arachidicola]